MDLFWKNKKVFLTGHTGFKGSWLHLWLQKMGANVTGFSLSPNTEPNLYSIFTTENQKNFKSSDIRDLDLLKNTLSQTKPEIVFHLAAQPLVRQSYIDPIETYSTNVMGTLNILEAIRTIDTVKSVIIVTTDKCYQNKEWLWGYRENEPLGGYDPYSSSKACAELLTASYRSSFFNKNHYEKHGIGIATVRAGNVIGGGDWSKDRLIPDLLNAFELNKSACIRNPHSIRPWQHVLEPLKGYLMLAENLYKDGLFWGDAWNFGPNDIDAKPVSWITNELINLWGDNAKWHTDLSIDQPHEAHWLKLDCSKAKQVLNWHPRWDLKYSLQMITEWHKAWKNKENMKNFSLKQIEIYESTNQS